ncbi:MAG: DUF6089 family protein, partial [Saprospiraceae bacterium]|nr:DUF6089 family protein [Saprospiraceae bacterium]
MRKTILYFFIATSLSAKAQTPHPWELGAGIGMAAVNGEINQLAAGEKWFGLHPAFSLHGRYNAGNYFAARLQLLYAQTSGKDQHYNSPPWRPLRGMAFDGPLFELAAIGEIYPFGLYQQRKGRNAESRKTLAPFFALGIGGTYSRPEVSWNDENGNDYIDPDLAAIDKAHAQRVDVAIPLLAGLRLRAGERMTLGLEGGIRVTLNDYLDGISVAGNPGKNDWFFAAGALLTYSFGKAKKQTRGRRAGPIEDKIPVADTDADGVPDDRDDCPDLPGLRSMKGCPDADRDGIADMHDLCPADYGLPALQGCPDRDEDGVADKDDNCPDIKGVAAYRGCPPVDRDKDGVADAEDLCPDMTGELRWKGCPDSDSDGIPDNKDACPGIGGPVHLKGCPDTDDDGIADKDDECPTIPGLAEKNGCPPAAAAPDRRNQPLRGGGAAAHGRAAPGSAVYLLLRPAL